MLLQDIMSQLNPRIHRESVHMLVMKGELCVSVHVLVSFHVYAQTNVY